MACHSVGFLFSGHVSLFGNLCLQLFLYFLFLLSDRGKFSAALQEKKKQLSRTRNVSVKLNSRMEVRVSCTLAIAIGFSPLVGFPR